MVELIEKRPKVRDSSIGNISPITNKELPWFYQKKNKELPWY